MNCTRPRSRKLGKITTARALTSHTWATFTYAPSETPINTNFNATDVQYVFGPPNQTTLKVLKQLTYADGSSNRFFYNSYGQVWKVETVAANSQEHVLNHVRTDLQTPASEQPDCPRFSETRTYVENFNVGQETVVRNELLTNQSYSIGGISGQATLIKVRMDNNPYGVISKTYVEAFGWQEGLPVATEDWVTENGVQVRKRWSSTDWTQDDPNAPYVLNPRVTESKVGDVANVKKTATEYYTVSPGSPVALYGLVKKVQVFDGVTGVLQKEAATEYNLDPAYVSRRIIGLPSKTEVSGLDQVANTLELVSKLTYVYDGDTLNNPDYEQNISPVQHDSSAYSHSFNFGRGNLTSTTRHDVKGETSAVTTSVKYNTAGAPVAQTDASGRVSKISYIDNYSDSTSPGSRNTYAYPTRITDPAGNYSSVQYRFDTGANVWAQSPKPDGQDNLKGKTTERIYDNFGRLEKEKIVNHGGAYTRYEYFPNGVQTKVYSTLADQNNNGSAEQTDEVMMSETWTDGAGRIYLSRKAHPSIAHAYTGQKTEYDILGRVKRTTPPTEIDSNWESTGEDDRGDNIWLWSTNEYDWKGRVTRIIPFDSNGNDGKDQLFSYDGCGCAGGEEVTIESELVPRDDQPTVLARKKQKIYSDVLGRNFKTEMFDWQGNVYKTVVNAYNGRDQVFSNRVYAGAAGSNDFRETTSSFDGHGRLKATHYPEQGANKFTTYTYFADDKPQTVTDARAATKHYTYNNLGLIQQISWTVPQISGIEIPTNVTFIYDNAGNRTQMNDSFGSVFYEYNELSQLKAETRHFNETIPLAPQPNNGFKIQYSYGLSGQLTSLTEPFGEVVTYSHNKTGKLTSVSGLRTNQNIQVNYVTNAEYRAWGAVKKLEYGDGGNMTMKFNDRLQADEYNFFAVNPAPNANATTRIKYGYYNDGRLKNSDIDYISASGTNNVPNFDRTYEYDYLGRLGKAKTGAEARGETETNPNNRPYRMTLGYNQFGDIISQERLHWAASYNYTFQYQNNRLSVETKVTNIPGWQSNTHTENHSYDDDGRRTDDETKYDADGRISYFEGFEQETDPDGHGDFHINWSSTSLKYSGDGRKIKTIKDGIQYFGSINEVKRIKYSIRSSVINEEIGELERNQTFNGSNVLYEYFNRKASIYANGEEIANRGIWNIGTSNLTDKTILKSTDASGVEHINILLRNDSTATFPVSFGETVTTDPFGAFIGANSPYPPTTPTGYPDPNDPNCTWNDYDDYECNYPDEYEENPESEENEAGSIPENTCYVDGIKEDCNEILEHPERYGLNDHGGSPSEAGHGDAAPSAAGPQGIHQNDDSSDNDVASAEAGERQFEIDYTGMEASFREGLLGTETYMSDDEKQISLWDLRAQTEEPTGGGGGGKRGRDNKGAKAVYSEERLVSCLKTLFGATIRGYPLRAVSPRNISFDRNMGGSFMVEVAGELIEGTTSVSRDSKELGKLAKDVGSFGDGSPESGLTLGTNPSENFVASDVAGNNKISDIAVFALFIHELGNSIAGQRYKNSLKRNSKEHGKNLKQIGEYQEYAKKYGTGKHTDAGVALEGCVFGGIVGLRSGRVGNSRETWNF